MHPSSILMTLVSLEPKLMACGCHAWASEFIARSGFKGDRLARSDQLAER